MLGCQGLPGTRLIAAAGRWFDAATVSRVFEPLVADWQREWMEAPIHGRARVRRRGRVAFARAALALAPRALVLTPMPVSMARRILSRLIMFVSIVSGVLTVPFLFELRTVPAGRLALLLMWLWPASLALVVPFAVGFLVDGIRRHSTPSPVERMAMVRTAIAAVVLMIVLPGWIVPASNQQFRLTVMADPDRPPARGVRELTTYQLFMEPVHARADGWGDPRDVALQRERHQRVSLVLLPLVMLWLRWRALDHPTPQWLLPAWLAALTTMGGYLVMRWNDAPLEAALGIGPGLGVWLPLLAFAAVGLARTAVMARLETTAR